MNWDCCLCIGRREIGRTVREILELQLTLKSLYNCLQIRRPSVSWLKEDNLQLSIKEADQGSAIRRTLRQYSKYADQVSARRRQSTSVYYKSRSRLSEESASKRSLSVANCLPNAVHRTAIQKKSNFLRNKQIWYQLQLSKIQAV